MLYEITPWTVTSSRITYEDRWIRLRSDDCVTATGVVVAPYHVVEYPDWVTVIPIMQDGSVMLVHEYRHGRRETTLGLVSGGVEEKDKLSADAEVRAAERELREETGYVANSFEKLLTSYPNPSNQTNKVTAFLAFGLTKIGDPQLEPSEAVEVTFQALDDILSALESGSSVMQSMHAASLFAANRRMNRQAR